MTSTLRSIAWMKKHGYAGKTCPINPTAGIVQGLRAHPAISTIGAPVGLAVVAAAASAEDIPREGIGTQRAGYRPAPTGGQT